MTDMRMPHNEIVAFCRRNHIAKLALYGSALRDQLKPESDIDLLVEFESNHVPGFMGLARIERELTELIGRQVDLRTAEDLSRYFRQEVMDTAKVEYAGT